MAQEHLILKFLDGTISPDERTALEAWASESPQNRKMMADFQRLWKLGVTEFTPDFDSPDEWTKLRNKLSQNEEKRSVKLFPDILKVAAAILTLLVSSFVIYLTLFKHKEIVHQTANNTSTVILPDGSAVSLNHDTRIAYHDDFGDNRSIEIEGEAFFDVRPDPEKPFSIEANATRITVLGTSFNVRAPQRGKRTEVFVVTGKVRFSEAGTNKAIILTPGTTGIFHIDERTLLADTVQDHNVLAWKNKQLVFRKAPLEKVLRTLSVYFRKELRADNENILACRFTGSFDDPTLEEVIETLHEALDLDVDVRGNGYVFDGEGCTEN